VLAFSLIGYSMSLGTVRSVPKPVQPPQPKPVIQTAAAPSQTTPEAAQQPLPAAEPPAPLPENHPNYTYYALISPSGALYNTSAEPFLPRISAQSGWAAVASDQQSPVIAVIDTGFALSHQDLAGRLVPGWDFVHNDSDPSAGTDNPNGSAVFHGTMTAGLAALLNPGAKIMPLQALNDNGVGSTDTVAAAVTYAADHGANVISLSLGSSSDDAFLQQQIDYAIGKGVLVVAAAGNDGCDCMLYPANYPEVLSVGASDNQNFRAGFSSYGANLDVMAPGTSGDVCSATYTQANQTSAYTCGYSGTSFATPIVAGLASLMLNQDPEATVNDLTRFIDTSADSVANMSGPLPNLQYGYGMIDVHKAVLEASLAAPRGELLNKHTVSLSSTDPLTDPNMVTTCLGIPGATCDVVLSGPGGASIDLGAQLLDDTGQYVYEWNALDLGLSPGAWQISASLADFNETATTGPFAFTVAP
jgi:thermitase